MKINIQIEDASPEEAALIFSGVVVSEAVGRAARKAVEKIVVRKPVPDPTCIEETGCAGCNETGLTDACEKCSPPVVKKEPASKKVAPEKKAIPEKKKIDNRSLGNNPNRWSHEEIAAIENCPDQKAAAKRYAKKFPDSKRKPWAVEQRWYIITKGKRGITPGAKAKNGVIALPAVKNVAERSPAPQSDGNKITILTGMDVRQIKPYKGSQILGTARVLSRDGDLVEVRNGNKKKHKIDISCLEIASGPEKSPAPHGQPVKNGVKKERLPFHLKKDPAPFEDPEPDDDHDIPSFPPDHLMEYPDIKIEGADELVDKMPEIRPPIREAHKRVHEAVTAANIRREPPAEFKVGAHVKQIKPYLDRKVSGIGCVTARMKGLIEVNFSGTQYYKIAPECLEVL